jgi:hypothetical protein
MAQNVYMVSNVLKNEIRLDKVNCFQGLCPSTKTWLFLLLYGLRYCRITDDYYLNSLEVCTQYYCQNL